MVVKNLLLNPNQIVLKRKVKAIMKKTNSKPSTMIMSIQKTVKKVVHRVVSHLKVLATLKVKKAKIMTGLGK
jgi:hypothetical protein